MEKRITNESNRKRVKVEEEPRVVFKPKAYIPKTVQVRLLKELKLNVRGAITGATYVFNGAGAEGFVDERDLPALLSKGKYSSCCGGTNSPYFEVLGG